MNSDLIIVLALLGASIAMFIMNRPRMDAVALIAMTALPLTGVITVEQALAGFSDPNIVLIAALFVIGDGLVRTGVAQRLGDGLAARAGGSQVRLIVLLMVTVGVVGSFMSSTGVVAIFIPIVLRVARNSAIAPGRLMMPLAVAALISGMMTLVATAPNLIVHSELVRRGHEGFHFFSFTPFGIPLLALAVIYMVAVRRTLGGRRSATTGMRPRMAKWVKEYALAGREGRLRVPSHSPLVGRRFEQFDLSASSGVDILAIERRAGFMRRLISPTIDTRLAAGDVLLLVLSRRVVDLNEIREKYVLEALPLSVTYYTDRSQEIGMVEMMVAAESGLVGKTVVEARFRARYGLAVIGIKRGRAALEGDVVDEPLRVGDTLLAIGPWRAIRERQAHPGDLIVLNVPIEMDDALPAAPRAPYALLSIAFMVTLMVTGVVPNVVAALLSCLLMGLFGCVDMKSSYRSVHWQSLVLIVGMMPFSLALQQTGGIDLAAGAMLQLAGETDPRVLLALIFAATALLGLFISNTATAVLMAPVALGVAEAVGASPYPFAMIVALAASCAFMTPVSSPVNTLVVGPGNYRFWDFLRIGLPLTMVSLGVSTLLVPLLLPL